MYKHNKRLESLLTFFRRLIPKSVFGLIQPFYHRLLSVLGALIYRFPGKGMTIIGVTGTKGKSTVVYMLARALEEQGVHVAAIGSLGFKIKAKEWPNNLHMTMPGRMKLQKFLRRSKNLGVTHVVLEATSQGMVQGRLAAIPVDGAVFTNLHPEHIESHGGIDNYIEAKQILFKKAKNIHVINIEDKHREKFLQIQAQNKITFGLHSGEVNQKDLNVKLKLEGEFNILNALAAIATVKAYGFDEIRAKECIEQIETVAGRMEYINVGSDQNFEFVVDYAHTPESMEAVYKSLCQKLAGENKLICVFGSDGGGRDTWKRPVFGRIASQYCGEIILTSENPYDSNPDDISDEIEAGIQQKPNLIIKRIIDRGEAMREAINDAKQGDTIVITGKGTEDSIVVANGKKIPWLDSAEAKKAILDKIK